MPPGSDAAVAPDMATTAAGTVTIALSGRLDANAGVELLAALKAHLDGGAPRIDIDLLGIEGWSPEGARALVRCRRMAGNLPGGLHYRTGPGVGHEALLEALAMEDEDPEAEAEPVAAAGSDPL
jgi:hypothetical protein